MADVEISYKGNKITELSESGTKILKTSGKYCEDDLTVDYTKSGTEPVIQSLSVTENGTYTAEDGVDGYSPVTVDSTIDRYELLRKIKKSVENVEFNKIEFTNISVGTNVTIYHGLNYAPQTILLVPKNFNNFQQNRYYFGFCTNPVDQVSYNNNIMTLQEEQCIYPSRSISAFYQEIGKNIPTTLNVAYMGDSSLYTFVVESNSETITLKNNTSGKNAMAETDFILYLK